jgi:hypothetical protein
MPGLDHLTGGTLSSGHRSLVHFQPAIRGTFWVATEAKPRLFKQDEWSTLSPDAFLEAEKRLKERLARRTQPAARNNDFAKLDAALLSSEESNALRRFLGGTRNSFDASLLRAALARQQGTRGDAA